MPRNPNKTPCSIPGCRAWAIRGSHPPRCSPHRHAASPQGSTLEPALEPALERSEGRSEGPTKVPTLEYSGGPALGLPFSEAKDLPSSEVKGLSSSLPSSAAKGQAKGHAEGLDPKRVGAPLGNQNRLVHGFYATDASLDAEIAIARLALRHILGMLLTGVTAGPNPSPLNAGDYARFTTLAFRGAGTVSRLLRARQVLTGDEGGTLSRLMDQVLDEVGEELGVQL